MAAWRRSTASSSSLPVEAKGDSLARWQISLARRRPRPATIRWSRSHPCSRILCSATYRQTSRVGPDLAAKDPYNRLLARGPRQRVDAEIVRDVALAASGLLDTHVGGDSVFPPAPAFLFEPPASYGPKQWPEASGPARYRRALYTFRYRSVPYPMLQAFDAPNGDFACVRRPKSNTPLQALTLLNDEFILRQARLFADRVKEAAPNDAAKQVDMAYRIALTRPPDEKEIAVAMDFLKKQSLADFTHVLLNLNEFLYVR